MIRRGSIGTNEEQAIDSPVVRVGALSRKATSMTKLAQAVTTPAAGGTPAGRSATAGDGGRWVHVPG